MILCAQVDQVVPATYVRQFVQEGHLDLLRAPACQGRRWQQDQGADDSQQDWTRDLITEPYVGSTSDSQADGQDELHRSRGRLRSRAGFVAVAAPHLRNPMARCARVSGARDQPHPRQGYGD